MEENGTASPPTQKFTIENIFKTIQQRLKHTQNQEGETDQDQTGSSQQTTAENEPSQRPVDSIPASSPTLTMPQETGSDNQIDMVDIKTETEDADYEHCYNEGIPEEDRKEEVSPVKEEARIRNEEGRHAELGPNPDVVFKGVSYRDPDDDGDSSSESGTSDSDSDSSSLSSDEDGFAPEMDEVPRTQYEVLPHELPPLEDLHITLPEETKLEELGCVRGIVDTLVVVDSTVDLDKYSPLNDDSVLFDERRQPLGKIFEVFGQVKAPSYTIRFNSTKDIEEKGIEIGLKVFFVPEPSTDIGEITHYVFVSKLAQMKGTDASYKGDNEPPLQRVEHSDDEEERLAKQRQRQKKKTENGDENVSSTEPRPKRRRRNKDAAMKRRLENQEQTQDGSCSQDQKGRNGQSDQNRPRRPGRSGHPYSRKGSENQETSGGRRGRPMVGSPGQPTFILQRPVFTGPESVPTEPPPGFPPNQGGTPSLLGPHPSSLLGPPRPSVLGPPRPPFAGSPQFGGAAFSPQGFRTPGNARFGGLGPNPPLSSGPRSSFETFSVNTSVPPPSMWPNVPTPPSSVPPPNMWPNAPTPTPPTPPQAPSGPPPNMWSTVQAPPLPPPPPHALPPHGAAPNGGVFSPGPAQFVPPGQPGLGPRAPSGPPAMFPPGKFPPSRQFPPPRA